MTQTNILSSTNSKSEERNYKYFPRGKMFCNVKIPFFDIYDVYDYENAEIPFEING